MERTDDLASLHIETLLWEVVARANKHVNADGCSIFLREEGTNRYILRDSTVLNSFLGNYYFTVAPEEQPFEKMGATKYAVTTRETLCLSDLRDCKYWSNYGLTQEELEAKPIGECELPHHQIASFLAVPLIDKGEVTGIIRQVRRRDKEPFTQHDKAKLETFVEEYLPRIAGAIDISRLLGIGSMLDLKDLCTEIVQVVKALLKGKGCSIFLLTEEKDGVKIYRCVGTTGLHAFKCDGTPYEIRHAYNEAFYEYEAGQNPRDLTTAVIKHGRNILVEDLTKFKSHEIFADIEREKGKFMETYFDENNRLIPAGPSMFIPLFSPRWTPGERDVIAVLRTCRPQGKEPFTPSDFRLCLFIAERLAKIISHSEFMSRLNQPLTTSDPVKFQISLNSLIDKICEVSGAPGATLFIKSPDHRQLRSISSSGQLKGEEIVYDLPPTPDQYAASRYTGYTVWVATFADVLRFNSLRERQKFSPQPEHSGISKCEVTPTMPDRFLGVPIKGENDDVLGVLRTAKTNTDAPFTPNDELLFCSLARRLSSILENLIDVRRREREKDEQIKKTFPKVLKSRIEELCAKEGDEGDFITNGIRTFFDGGPQREKDIGGQVLQAVSSAWNEAGIVIGKTPLESFRFFDEQILSELPGYRSHFIHQYQVFLLGYYIIKMLSAKSMSFCESYRQSLSSLTLVPEEEKEAIANIAWLVAATFHDVAYPLEETRRWLPEMIVNFLGDEAREIVPEVPIEGIFFKSPTYLSFVDELARFFTNMEFTRKVEEADFRAWLQGEVTLNKDHGVLSALILMRPRFRRKEQIILPAALAIALHKRLGLRVKAAGVNISYDRYPLFFLLTYCDLVQEWNRDLENGKRIQPVLKKIAVTEELDEIAGAGRHIPDEVMANKKTIYVYSEIEVAAGAQPKIDECKCWLRLICSSNPYFIIKINDQFVVPLVDVKLS